MRLADGRVRKLRRSSEDPGCAHELTFSCFRGLPLLARQRTRRWMVAALDATRRKHDLELWAYVVRPEHVHVLFLPRDSNYRIRAILQSIKQPVMRRAINFLREHGPDWMTKLTNSKTGTVHFWQPGGEYDCNVNSAKTAWAIVNYMHQNPVKRGLVDGSVDWPWSSARWYAGERENALSIDATPP